MSAITAARRAVLDGVADELLQHRPTGRRIVAVDGADPGRAARFADDLAAVLRERGERVVRLPVGVVDPADLRERVLRPFRAGETTGADDVVGVVDGSGLLADDLSGAWHHSVWTFAGDELPHAGAVDIVDLTDEDAPAPFVYDYCALPPSAGQRSVPVPQSQA